LIEKFSFFHNRLEVVRRYPEDQSKINFEINHRIFDKTLNLDDEYHIDIKEKISNQLKYFQSEKEDFYLKKLKPYLKKLILSDLSGKIIDFSENSVISHEYFERTDFSLNHLKKLLDFIRCNKFYEDIPIYLPEYSEFIQYAKDFLLTHYNHSSTYEDEFFFYRLNNFFSLLLEIMEGNEASYNIFINHNTAIRSLIKFFLSKEAYETLSNSPIDNDEDFFLVCPKFSAEYKLLVRVDKKIQLYVDGRNITQMVKKEFLTNESGEYFIDYYKFKSYLNRKHNFII
jgi:hypothetical protein